MKLHSRSTCAVCALLALLAAWPVFRAYSQEPNNAAMLYRQAFTSLPKGNDQMEHAVSTLPDGVDPNNRIREYLRQCEPAINLAVAASGLAACDWGLQYSQGSQMAMPHLTQMRTLARLMKAHVDVLAAGGQYRQALERSLTVRRMARHVGDEITISLLVNRAIDTLANQALQDTLGTASPDEKTMPWLRQQWASRPGEDRQMVNAVKGDQKCPLDRDLLIEAATMMGIAPGQLERIRKGDDAFFEASRKYAAAHLQSVLSILEETDPYEKKFSQLEALVKKPLLDIKENPHALMATLMSQAYPRILTLDTRARSDGNLLRAGIEIYLIKARTKTIPDQLPPGMPKDPFTGEDFGYEKTPEGFTLTRWTDDPAKDKTYHRTFKVK